MESRIVHLGLIIPCFLVMLMFGLATCDIEQDKKRCANQVLGLATCLPYVSGQSKAPPMDCCTGFEQVLQKNPECICLLIKDRNDPSVGLKINATLALGLPTRCNTHTNQSITDCPAILHLPPNSPDAKVFEDFADSGKKSNATAPASGNSSAGMSATADQKSGGKRNGWFGTEMASWMLLAMIAVQILPINR